MVYTTLYTDIHRARVHTRNQSIKFQLVPVRPNPKISSHFCRFRHTHFTPAKNANVYIIINTSCAIMQARILAHQSARYHVFQRATGPGSQSAIQPVRLGSHSSKLDVILWNIVILSIKYALHRIQKVVWSANNNSNNEEHVRFAEFHVHVWAWNVELFAYCCCCAIHIAVWHVAYWQWNCVGNLHNASNQSNLLLALWMKEDDVDGSRLPRTLFVSTKKKMYIARPSDWLQNSERRTNNNEQRATSNENKKTATLIRIDLFRGVIEVTVWMVENP